MDAGNQENLKLLRVLYAEDDPVMRKQLSKRLNQLCAEVWEAGNGLEAMQIFADKKPDIILADLNMPAMNGLELIRAIRKEGHDTPVIMITAHVSEEYLLDALRLSLVDYLVKPFTYDSLTQALIKCLRQLEKGGSLKVSLGEGVYYSRRSGTLEKRSEVIELPRKERLLLELLLSQRHRMVSKTEIEQTVWTEEGMSESALKSVLVKLRRKIGKTSIINTPHIGYRLILPDENETT
ncbi:MAG: response regulator transcription factor [Campylobacterales bacterium]